MPHQARACAVGPSGPTGMRTPHAGRDVPGSPSETARQAPQEITP